MDELAILASTQHGVVTAAQCHQHGYTTSQIGDRCRAGVWRRLFRGIYLVEGGHGELAKIQAALLVAGPTAVAVRQTASYLHDIPAASKSDHVCIGVPRQASRHHRAGIKFYQDAMDAAEVVDIRGMRVTSVVRTLADLTRIVDRNTAVSILDACLHNGQLAVADLDAIARKAYGKRGAVIVRERVSLADGHAASPLETRARLACIDAGIPPNELQYEIRDQDGILLAIADMAWLKARLLVELDGAEPHERPQALFRDRRRQNDLIHAGWRILRFTWADVQRPAYLVGTIRRALSMPAAKSA